MISSSSSSCSIVVENTLLPRFCGTGSGSGCCCCCCLRRSIKWKKCVSEEEERKKRKTEGKKGSNRNRKLMNDLIKRTLLPLFYAINSIFYRAIIKWLKRKWTNVFVVSFGSTNTAAAAVGIDGADDDETSVLVLVDRKLCYLFGVVVLSIAQALVADINHTPMCSVSFDWNFFAKHLFDGDNVGCGGAEADVLFPSFVGIYPPQLRSMFAAYESVESRLKLFHRMACRECLHQTKDCSTSLVIETQILALNMSLEGQMAQRVQYLK